MSLKPKHESYIPQKNSKIRLPFALNPNHIQQNDLTSSSAICHDPILIQRLQSTTHIRFSLKLIPYFSQNLNLIDLQKLSQKEIGKQPFPDF
jgi:hypothetical protein